MAPFRNRDRSNRSGRGPVEHNVLEGLPINQYREMEIAVGPNSSESKQVDKDAWPELPMPKDSHLLPLHSQQLLRAARSGRIYRKPAPPEEDVENMDEEDDSKQVQQGFTVRKYVKVARHLEEPEPEFLAKRRKGLPSPYVPNGQLPTQPPPMRETKVKKLDAEGNVSVYKVLVPEGQTVEGEVQPTEAAIIEATPAAAAPGTVVEGVGVVNAEGVVVANEILQQTPPRRRPPPPKKKTKRSGPGRKKKVVFLDGTTEQGTPASGTSSDLLRVPGVKQEGGSVEPSDGDTPMADAGDEEEGSGDDGSEDDAQEEGERTPTPGRGITPSQPSAEPTTEPMSEPIKQQESHQPEPAVEATPPAEAAPVPIPDVPSALSAPPLPPVEPQKAPLAEPAIEKIKRAERDPSSSPELPLSAIAHSRQNSINQVPAIPSTLPSVETIPIEPVPAEPPLPTIAPAPTLSPAPTPAHDPVPSPVLSPPPPAPAHTSPPPAEDPAAEDPAAADSEPDVLGSLERQLEKDSEDLAGS
ncbi:hypothetical protein BDV95DRAFT_589618 [Massariosphaeria phaeospora]|uniref:Uncharacterized protein n=1 Tax=Massariosphaeria phaeospora TaxID=100035 RepID=A0A7C8IL53_9PLEO|nr:hypothetical protein BDV95DRAFT_589618 [Massariosphaeria phaeospora]